MCGDFVPLSVQCTAFHWKAGKWFVTFVIRGSVESSRNQTSEHLELRALMSGGAAAQNKAPPSRLQKFPVVFSNKATVSYVVPRAARISARCRREGARGFCCCPKEGDGTMFAVFRCCASQTLQSSNAFDGRLTTKLRSKGTLML